MTNKSLLREKTIPRHKWLWHIKVDFCIMSTSQNSIHWSWILSPHFSFTKMLIPWAWQTPSSSISRLISSFQLHQNNLKFNFYMRNIKQSICNIVIVFANNKWKLFWKILQFSQAQWSSSWLTPFNCNEHYVKIKKNIYLNKYMLFKL